MRYFSFNELSDEAGGQVVTMSEEEVRKEYFPYWQEQMYKKYGREYVDENYSFEECLEDWCVLHWAWEVASAPLGGR